MSHRSSGRAALTLAALLAGACAHALQPLPADSELGRVDPDLVDPALAVGLIGEAEEAFARRPDPQQVERAAELFLHAAVADPTRADAVIGAARARTWLARHTDDPDRKRELARSAVQTAQWCERREPDNPECPYWLVLAVGVQSDARRSTAIDGVKVMVRLLREAIEQIPDLDHAGPYRVLARTLTSAPGWPTGPGDPDEGLELALEAVRRAPDYPPNHLALGEAYLETDQRNAARDAFTRALELASSSEEPDHADWETDARDGLARSGLLIAR